MSSGHSSDPELRSVNLPGLVTLLHCPITGTSFPEGDLFPPPPREHIKTWYQKSTFMFGK